MACIMFRRIFDWLKSRVPDDPWSVVVAGDHIVTSDGQGSTRSLPMDQLQSVVVATDDSGPWGYDVVFLMYGSADSPAGLFPLEAQGMRQFVDWLTALPGYDDRELSRAMGSTKVARFTVYTRPSIKS